MARQAPPEDGHLRGEPRQRPLRGGPAQREPPCRARRVGAPQGERAAPRAPFSWTRAPPPRLARVLRVPRVAEPRARRPERECRGGGPACVRVRRLLARPPRRSGDRRREAARRRRREGTRHRARSRDRARREGARRRGRASEADCRDHAGSDRDDVRLPRRP